RNAINAVLATFQINLVTPFLSGAEIPIPDSAAATTNPSMQARPSLHPPTAERSPSPARSSAPPFHLSRARCAFRPMHQSLRQRPQTAPAPGSVFQTFPPPTLLSCPR